MLADSLSIGVLVGVPVVAICLIVGVALIYLGVRTDNSYGDGSFLMWGGIATVVITVGIAAYGFYPYSGEYHRWHETSGKVTEVSSRFLGGDKSTTQKFVVRFANGDERGCLDTRCALVKVGDRLTLTCKRQWQFAGQDGWDCNYVGDNHA